MKFRLGGTKLRLGGTKLRLGGTKLRLGFSSRGFIEALSGSVFRT